MGKIIRIVLLIVIAGFLVALIIFNGGSKPKNSEKIWDERTTMGNLGAKNYYVMYTDIMCPYCSVFARQLMWNEDEFRRDYIEGKDILFEVRLTDMLYESYGDSIIASQNSAEGAYCAKREDRFWDYYHAALQTLWDDYHSKGIGISKTAPKIDGIDSDYWLKIGEKIGLGEDFKNCYNNHETLEEIKENTTKAASVTSGGVPYFQFNNFTNSGFDPSWDWEYVKKYLDAGLK